MHDASEYPSETVRAVQYALLTWFAESGRDLPWRRTRDPYRVLVSEVMLQQIQVARAIPFYEAFVARFPTVQALAEAPIADVIRVWSDLGRYRRIVYLHRAAREIVARFGGVVPQDVEALRSLPGVGPYTAGAVACFAFEQDVGFVDTNVRRVIGRLLLGADGSERAGEREIAELARQVVPPGRGWDWNQGLLDFGALHCTARAPKCGTCPLAAHCAAYPTMMETEADAKPRTAADKRFAFAGSNRYYRGRILAALREHDAASADGIPLSTLGARVKPDYADGDRPWLYGVVAGLAKDGLAAIAEETPGYGQGSSDGQECVAVRLP